LLLFLLVACLAPFSETSSSKGGEPVCNFKFFPASVETDLGPRQMTILTDKLPKIQAFTDVISEKPMFSFSFVARLLKPINPRLCRWQLVLNHRTDTYINENDIRRFPLTSQYGLPTVRCMLNSKTPGVPVTQYPLFSRTGAIMPTRNSALQKLPLCGDLFYFRTNTLLHFSGACEDGMVKILECQSGTERDSQNYVMNSLFQVNCTVGLGKMGATPYLDTGGMLMAVASA